MTASSIGFALLLAAGAALAADETVSSCGNDTELRADLAAMQASGGGRLTFACAESPATIILSGTLPTISTATTIDGGQDVVLSGGNAYRHFVVVASGTLTLRGLTVANAFAPEDGGAVRSQGTLVIEDSRFEGNQVTTQSGGAILALGPTTIRRSTFFDNVAVNGGALYPRFPNAVVRIEDSVFQYNRTTATTPGLGLGGAILAWDGANVTIERTRFIDNRALDGSAYYNTPNSQLVVRRSTFDTNRGISQNRGGGIFNAGDATVEETLFVRNSATHGGSIWSSGTLTVVNSTFSTNASASAAGIYNTGTATLRNVTFRGNTFTAITHQGASMTVRNTVVDHTNASGASAGCSGNPASSGFNLATDTTCNWTQPSDRQNVPSDLGPLTASVGPTLAHVPSPTSLLVDNGTVIDCPSVDQRGQPRPVGLSCDIGAVEVGALLFADGFE
jgi:hypothetical protein